MADLPPQRFSQHDPRLVEASIKRAEEFYQWDKQLAQADRRKLASYFWQKIAIFPLLGLPVVWGFVVTPNVLKKRGVLNPKKSYRLLQFGLGFMGLGVGFQLSGSISSLIHMQLLRANEPAWNAYNCLRVYPPQLGSRYFSMTAASPDLRMKDPHTIDWKTNPLFPVILVMNREVIQQIKRAERERHDKFQAAHESRKHQEIEQRSNRSEEGSLTGTSWDNIIAKQDQSQPPRVQPNAQPNTQPRAQSTSPLPNAQPPPLPSIGSLPTLSYTDDFFSSSTPPSSELSEEQRKFDEMLERERQQSMVDDFSDSDKKWE